MKKLTVLVSDVFPGVNIHIAGHYGEITDVKRIGDWTSLTFKIDHAVSLATMILTNDLPIEILVED